MKKLKTIKKHVKRFVYRYINGTRGAVSIMLALIMSPLLSISLLLVESARLQSVVELVDEITGTSAFSVLADYDPYLDERFGLFATSQQVDVNQAFGDLLDKNINLIEGSATINSKTASGTMPLSSVNILKQQILESSEISVAAEMLIEGIDLDELLEKLEKSLGVEDIKKEIETVNTATELTGSVQSLIESIGNITSHYDTYAKALSEYKTSASTFESKATAYINAILKAEQDYAAEQAEKSTESTEEGAEETFDAYEDSEVKKAWTALSTARDDYKKKATTLKGEITTMKGYITSVMSSISSITEKARKYNDSIGNDSLAEQCTTATSEWILSIVEEIARTLKVSVNGNVSDVMQDEIEALQAQINKLGKLQNKTMNSSWTEDKVNKEYGVVSISAISKNIVNSLTLLRTKLDTDSAVSDSNTTSMIDLLSIAKELMGVSGLYDATLNSSVNSSNLYTATTMSMTSQLAITSMTSLITACETFTSAIKSVNVIKALKALGTLLASVATFLLSIVTWIGETLYNLVLFIGQGPKEWYNSLLLYGYAAYNFPNRTTYEKGKTLSGYKYNNIFTLAGGRGTRNVTGALSDLANINDGEGSDKMFKGAHTEYLLVGSTNEIMNQSTVFFNLYLFRLALDLGPVLTNKEVSIIAAATGPGAWVVKLAIAIIEPLLDTIILVNGGKSYLFKDTVYCSYSGFVILQNDLVGITAIGDGLKNKLKDTIKANNGTPNEKGFCDASYTEHMILLMLLGVDQTTYLQRVQNLIQMEAACKYKDEYTFSLSKSYTYIYSDVNYTLNPMFDLESLTNGGALKANNKQYTGY